MLQTGFILLHVRLKYLHYLFNRPQVKGKSGHVDAKIIGTASLKYGLLSQTASEEVHRRTRSFRTAS